MLLNIDELNFVSFFVCLYVTDDWNYKQKLVVFEDANGKKVTPSTTTTTTTTTTIKPNTNTTAHPVVTITGRFTDGKTLCQ